LKLTSTLLTTEQPANPSVVAHPHTGSTGDAELHKGTSLRSVSELESPGQFGACTANRRPGMSAGPALPGFPGRAAVSQLIGGTVAIDDQAVLGANGGKLGELARDLLPHPAEGDPEDALAARQEVVDLVR
jgi:hypothetical protein